MNVVALKVRRAFFVAALSFPVCLWAAQPAKLRAVVPDIAPYGLNTPNHQAVGLAVDILQRVASLAGYAADVRVVPYARVYSSLSSSEADAAISLPAFDPRQTLIELAAVFPADTIVVTRKQATLQARSDMRGLRIARIRNGCSDLSPDDTGREFIEINGFSEGLRMLAAGRVDGLCTTPEVFTYHLRKESMQASDFGKPFVVKRAEAYLYLRPGAPVEMQRRLQDAFATLQRNKIVDQLLQAYLP